MDRRSALKSLAALLAVPFAKGAIEKAKAEERKKLPMYSYDTETGYVARVHEGPGSASWETAHPMQMTPEGFPGVFEEVPHGSNNKLFTGSQPICVGQSVTVRRDGTVEPARTGDIVIGKALESTRMNDRAVAVAIFACPYRLEDEDGPTD